VFALNDTQLEVPIGACHVEPELMLKVAVDPSLTSEMEGL
jgi:hypothetical protein